MKKLNLLKVITDIVYYVNIAAAIIAPLVAIVVLFKINSAGFEYDGKQYTKLGAGLIISSLLKFVLYLALVYCLFLFRKIILLFQKLKVFDNVVIDLFHRIGKYLILIGFGFILVSCIPINYYYTTYHPGGFTNHYEFEYNFHLSIVWIAIGLFFQVLSEVFSNARRLKEENDLTI
ncbi:DUF2975 domain-containing protein [Flavobacteriaceae bacterium SZ-1-7]|uniref:DUF2975 domain-containing protein n=1 Tax=Tamlana sedimenti TaxID=3134126 RepID=UPI003123326A